MFLQKAHHSPDLLFHRMDRPVQNPGGPPGGEAVLDPQDIDFPVLVGHLVDQVNDILFPLRQVNQPVQVLISPCIHGIIREQKILFVSGLFSAMIEYPVHHSAVQIGRQGTADVDDVPFNPELHKEFLDNLFTVKTVLDVRGSKMKQGFLVPVVQLGIGTIVIHFDPFKQLFICAGCRRRIFFHLIWFEKACSASVTMSVIHPPPPRPVSN
jgi:hypothetical protein